MLVMVKEFGKFLYFWLNINIDKSIDNLASKTMLQYIYDTTLRPYLLMRPLDASSVEETATEWQRWRASLCQWIFNQPYWRHFCVAHILTNSSSAFPFRSCNWIKLDVYHLPIPSIQSKEIGSLLIVLVGIWEDWADDLCWCLNWLNYMMFRIPLWSNKLLNNRFSVRGHIGNWLGLSHLAS